MKKQIFYFASAALALGLTACSSDELEGSVNYDANGGPIFTASIEQPVVPASTRSKLVGNAFKWVEGDHIGIFYNATAYDFKTTDDNGAFTVANGEGETENGVEFTGFDWANNAKYAFYPYEALKKAADEGSKPTITNNKFYVVLDGMTVTHGEVANTYGSEQKVGEEDAEYGDQVFDGFIPYTTETANQFKMPMTGTLSGTSVKFKNLTAIVKVTVRNIPAKFTRAILENEGTQPLGGFAKIDIASQELSILTTDNNKTAIGYEWNEEQTISTKTFYFVVPVADYASGLSFYLEDSNAGEDTPLYIFTAQPLPAELNKMYVSEWTINGAGDGLESGEIARVNEALADGDESVDVTTDDVDDESIIILPRAYKKADGNTATVTLNLSKLATSKTKTITIMEDQSVDGETYAAAKNVVINGAANEGTLTLDIQLPNSKVTLGTATGAESTTIAEVKSETAEDEVLEVASGVTVSKLTINGGDVHALDGSTITASGVQAAEETRTIIYQAGSSVAKDKASINASNIDVVPEFVYLIQSATTKVTEPIDVTESLEERTTDIKVKKGADIIIDLKGFTLKSTSTVLTLAEGATVKIQNTLGTGQTEGTDGIIETTSTSEPAIVIKGGSQVNLTAGTVKSVETGGGQVVSATGAGSKFKLSDDGSIVGLSGANALFIAEGATTELTGGKVTIGDVTLNAAGTSTIGISLPNWLKSVANSAKLTVNNEAITLGKVKANGSEIELTVKSLKGVEVTNAGSLKLNKGTIADGCVKVDNKNSKFTMVDGSITYSDNTNAVITATAGTTVDIQGGTVAATGSGNSALSLTNATATISGAAKITASGAEAIVDAEGTDKSALTINGGAIETTKALAAAIKIAYGTDVIITDGSITGTESAIDITSGTLKVKDSGEPKLKGNTYVVKAVPDNGKTVKVYLDNAKAYYTGSKDKYSIYNHNSQSTAVAAIESISGGHFIGDIISDNSKHFVSGGYFQSCTTLESTIDYFVTTKKPGKAVDAENYWTVVERTLD